MKTRAFTVVELGIVLVIILLLAAMAIPAIQKVRANSQKAIRPVVVEYQTRFMRVSISYDLELVTDTKTGREYIYAWKGAIIPNQPLSK